MSWNAPTTWAEVSQSIRSGYSFRSARLGVSATSSPGAVCGYVTVRHELSQHEDRFAQDIVRSADELHRRYMESDRHTAERPEDIVYAVLRDGHTIAALTRDGEVIFNPRTATSERRFSVALDKVLPALAAQSRALAGV